MVYKERFIDLNQINEVILMVQKMSAEQGFTAALAGGVALQVYGSDLLTRDVDFVLDREPADKKNLRKARPLGFGGHSYVAPNGAKVGLIVRNDDYAKLYQDALADLVMTSEGTPIVTPEHLAAMKLAAGREKDILALKWMIRRKGLLKLTKARSVIYRFMGRFAQDRFNDTVDQAIVEKEVKRRRGIDPEEE